MNQNKNKWIYFLKTCSSCFWPYIKWNPKLIEIQCNIKFQASKKEINEIFCHNMELGRKIPELMQFWCLFFLPFVFIFSRRKITKKALVLVSFFRSLNNKVLRSSWINIYANFHLNWINGTARLWFMSIFKFDLAGKCVNIVPYLYVHALRLLKFIFFIFSSS